MHSGLICIRPFVPPLLFGENILFSSLLSKNLNIKIYRIIILSVVLYGCKNWSLTLRVEGRLRLFENRVLRIVFGPKRDEVTGEWIELHEENHDLHSSLPPQHRLQYCNR
jgi:hypothetical protein